MSILIIRYNHCDIKPRYPTRVTHRVNFTLVSYIVIIVTFNNLSIHLYIIATIRAKLTA